MESNNMKLTIPQNLDLNELPIEMAIEEKINNDSTPMRKALLNDPVLKIILNKINAIDFEDKASKGKVTDMRLKIFQTNDQTKKDKLEKEIKSFTPDEDSKHVIIMEELLKIADENDSGLLMSNSIPYVYNGGYWVTLDMEMLNSFLENVAEKSGIPWLKARQHKVKEKLLKQFMATASFREPKANESEIKINLLNGTYCFNNGDGSERSELRKAKKEDFFKYQLPFNYDPNATAPLFIKYLNEVLPDEDAQKVLAEYMAYIFTFKMKLEKTLFLYGSGANGKSVFFDIITALLGEENISHYSIERLLDATGYYRAKIVNKLLNYSSELGAIKDVQLFKKLTSGEPIDARLPYGQPFTSSTYGKFIFNTNELPVVEQTEAFLRRPIIIHFGQTIPVENRDINLAKKIIDSELSGIFNFVLGALRRLVKQGGFSQSEFIDNQLLKYKRDSNTVEQFLENEEWTKSEKNKVSLKDFFPHYFQYCKTMGHHSVNSQKFSARLRNLGYKVDRGTKGYYYVWCEKKMDNDFMDTSIIKSIIQ